MLFNRRTGARRRPTYANVTSTLALFLVLAGGTAFAAGLPKGSVDSRAVKNNSLTGIDIKNGSLTPADLRDDGSFEMLEGENSVMVEPGKSGQVTAECEEQNEETPRAIAGSAYFQNQSGYIWMSKSARNLGGNKWTVAGTNTGTTPQKLTARAFCLFFT